ncbi:gamma-glutamylputrescine oxidase [Arboricoccus pini]|uniref:Gamma-glutamylputrescine oxidase n=1 Tax=Arboricoccus pini TaxID=1963835 RepID=A0A212R3J5_9PROT|nr:FAD-binding oxidoreductase [Arboricoccus pini]SNB66572.1 gamma-glutamylputrescine oxidase [Arboricoccus pini]
MLAAHDVTVARAETAGNDYPDTYYSRTITHPRRFPALDERLQTEVCVIGGGLAGTATALALAEAGRKVVLLEANRIGWGASGRNGGFASPGLPGGMIEAIEELGVEKAREIYALTREAQAQMKARVARHAIACGPLTQGALRCGMRRSPKRTVPDYVETMNRQLDAELVYWSAAQVGAVLKTERYRDGAFNPHSFAIHPLNFCRGMAVAVEALGGRVHEGAAVRELDLTGSRKRVRLGGSGEVSADHVVLACGAYVERLFSPLSRATIPIATFVASTPPLGRLLDQAIATPHAISDFFAPTNYYRRLDDGRLLWGGRVFALERSKPAIARQLKQDITTFYPSLKEVTIETCWSGLMPYLRHKLPSFGSLGEGVWYASGFGGLGVVLTTLAGDLIAGGIVNKDDRWRLFAAFGLPYAAGKWGRIPAQLIYWREQLQQHFARAT